MIRIVTDSSCDLPLEVVERHRISVVPLTIRFGDEEFVDGVELSADGFWDRIAAAEDLPETATPPAGRFHEAFRDLVSEGADGVVAVCLSSELSGTVRAARLAAENSTAGIPIRVVDCRSVSLGLGLSVVAAAGRAEAGGTIDSVEETAREAAHRTNLFAVLDTLDHLRRGGRIGGAAAMVGEMLKVKPLITLRDGAVAAAGRIRTRKRTVGALLDHLAAVPDPIEEAGVIHSGHEEVGRISDALAEMVGHDPMVARLGPVVGTHGGPGVLGVVYRTS
jgi:DegV family protein with EDD domain